jgi:hypothetical protein
MDGMARSDRATFRLPAVALFVPVLLFVCITPLATVDGAWWVLYIVPVLALVWVLITHTTATAERITTYGLLGTRKMTWAELDQLELPDARWAIAVAQDGRRLRLPMVRPRDVPRLVAVSGGSLRLGDSAPAVLAGEQQLAEEQPVGDNQADLNLAEASTDPAESFAPSDPDSVSPSVSHSESVSVADSVSDAHSAAEPGARAQISAEYPVISDPALQVNPPR